MDKIKIIKSNRKTISLEIKPDCTIEVKVPANMSDSDIQNFLHLKSKWIENHLKIAKERQKQASEIVPLTEAEINALANQALEVIPKRVAYFSKIVGVTYGRITIRNQKSRWGSCSSKGNLNFNCLLMLTPPEVLDYVVVHELCHRKELNHSPKFWAEVGKILPDYEKQRLWLKKNGNELVMRMLA